MSTAVSEQYLAELRKLIKSEFTIEVRDKTSLVADCLVCKVSPSADCLVCRRKYRFPSPSFKAKKHVSNRGCHSAGKVAKSSSLLGFGDQYSDPSKFKLANSTYIEKSKKNISNNGMTEENSRLNAIVLTLRQHIQSLEINQEKLLGQLDESMKREFKFQEDLTLAQEKAQYLDFQRVQQDRKIFQLELLVSKQQEDYTALLKKTRVSEACRSNSAKALSMMRKISSQNSM